MSLKIALVLASVLSTADFLKCYNCAGDQCTDNPLTCPQGFDRCMISNTAVGTAKACGSQALCNVAQQLKVNCCEEDLCNGAGTIGKNLLLLLVPVASIFVLS
ncbi:CD59 glycoprotein-like [Clupea harengus]|uniref:CD59 glycoprotein-like n=1 Tax=Clupea harengus TaxID=7950 RepID=A0A6P8FT27_CLUHA|nr:CD59 glycoprotein-like [Clupea harengus]XP_031426663.1 CD59 glycoprotein-like [Clupea harengus]